MKGAPLHATRGFAALLICGALCGCAEGPSAPLPLAEQVSSPVNLAPSEKPKPNVSLDSLAADLEAHGGHKTALALYENAAQTSGDPQSVIALGDAYERGGLSAEAIKAYRVALKNDPANGEIKAKLGSALIKGGKADEGLSLLREAAASTASAQLSTNLGIAELLNGDPERAAEALRKANELAPDDLDIQTNLALAEALSGRAEESVLLMRKVAQAPKANANHKSNYALVLALAGRAAEARSLVPAELSKAQFDAIVKRAERVNASPDAKGRARILGMAG